MTFAAGFIPDGEVAGKNVVRGIDGIEHGIDDVAKVAAMQQSFREIFTDEVRFAERENGACRPVHGDDRPGAIDRDHAVAHVLNDDREDHVAAAAVFRRHGHGLALVLLHAVPA